MNQTAPTLTYQQLVSLARQLPLAERVRLVRDILAEPMAEQGEQGEHSHKHGCGNMGQKEHGIDQDTSGFLWQKSPHYDRPGQMVRRGSNQKSQFLIPTVFPLVFAGKSLIGKKLADTHAGPADPADQHGQHQDVVHQTQRLPDR